VSKALYLSDSQDGMSLTSGFSGASNWRTMLIRGGKDVLRARGDSIQLFDKWMTQYIRRVLALYF
jgi:hypothetical protein